MGGIRHYLKKTTKKVAHGLGISSHDLGMIALSPFTAGASLLGTSSAKAMLRNPGGTLTGALTGLEEGGPLGAFLGALEGGGGFNAMFNGGTSAKSAANDAIGQQYRYNLMLQQQNQQWQTAMANTAHQREVADLKASGLNPVLSAGGSGAPIGSPGGGSVGMPDTVGEKTAEMQNKVAQGTLLNEILNGIAQRKLAGSQGAKNSADILKAQADIMNDTKRTDAEIVKMLADAGLTQKQIDYWVKHGIAPGSTTSVKVGPVTTTLPVGYINPDKDNNNNSGGNSAKKEFKWRNGLIYKWTHSNEENQKQ